MKVMRLLNRASGSSGTDQFLDLIADPFQTQVQSNSIYAAVVYSFVVSGGLFLLFCFLRPRHSLVYAPRARHADEKHAPIPLGRDPFSWLRAIKDVKEQELVDKIGLDAVVFLRFLRMMRNIFIVLTIVGCAILIPVTLVGGSDVYENYSKVATLMKFTPQYIFGSKFWWYVVCAYLLEATVCSFIWWNYRAVLRLRRAYFNSPEYQSSLHSRTLLLTHIPESSRTDAGIADLVDQARQLQSVPRTAIARNVKDLPDLIQSHDETVRELEAHLAKYLSNPDKLPEKRPTCKVAKEDRGTHGSQHVDAIDYLAGRIARLKSKITVARESVDKRNPMPYGFASYSHIEDAHAVAYAARKKGPSGCTVYLAPKPHDLLWQNLPMSRATRRTRGFWDGFWMILLTAAFIVPNILTAVFLSDFSHLGLVWPAFQDNLQAHPLGWGIAQGILAPLVQTLMYMALPVIFRRLYTHSGDVSKTSRERHVTSRLYAFFVFNNMMIFSVFGSAWRFVASVIAAQDQGVWEAIRSAHLFSKVMTGLCNVSTFWLTWQMQRNLSAAIDIVQAWPLIWGFIQRKFFSPTPRDLIELSAPQPFRYADYYNNYLFVSTVGLVFGMIQPIVLPITAFYIGIDLWFKKYLLQYVLITKTESGGRFWRFLVNRLLFAVILANAVIALIVGAQGIGSIDSVRNGGMLYAMIPLPILLAGFKWYCKKSFDTKLTYFSIEPFSDAEGTYGNDKKRLKRNDKIAARFGHPALYKQLITPMVHAKSQHLIKEIFGAHPDAFQAGHRPSADHEVSSNPYGYSDMYLAEMDPEHVGQSSDAHHMPQVEVVAEEDLDFENFKKRAEFRDEFGGDGELYGRPDDLVSRPGTPSTLATMTDAGFFPPNTIGGSTRNSSKTKLGEDSSSLQGDVDQDGTSYEHGYQLTPRRDRFESVDIDIPSTPLDIDDVLGTGATRAQSHSTSHHLLAAQDEPEDTRGCFNGSSYHGQDEDTSYETYRR
ncbi:DUF221-domain-containing protein [Aaosphaeria arxii CBS 175.79]|uniref:DUF221-domain-containing protein n=1 Tax=Aaosphaeria arxii CBS 175.79 TaxID=1450172 RepID=A0A6A5YAA3_9PLEO|nr:DUF221-domain-containing protein [Aaosphaeria arxii CBS 175.79]KAF2021947.1 DUF221-domain-containing protein [Aaosphaeria arxii CBS 175.79]